MIDRMSDVALRIAKAEPDQLKEIFTKEIQAKGWSEDERETLMQAFDTRACFLNKLAIGLVTPRWK